MLSVILPSYNEEKMIAKATARMAEILQPEKIDYELLFIDDGSRDGTWAQINEAAEKDSHVVGVHFSRNFGKEAAMFAGLEQAKGDCCVVIDCDLQHPPEKIVEMYRLWEQGYEVVEGIKEDRGEESGLHKFAANSFYGLISKATGMDMSSSSDFKLLDRKVVDTLNSLPERNVFFRALSFWVGYKKTSVSYCVQERTEGVSKWSTKSLIKYALTNISSFSSAPLHIVTVLGFIMLRYVVNQYDLAVIPSLLIGHTLLSIPYIMRVITSSLANFDFAVEEAACSLGATRQYTFFHIVLPNIKSGIASACIMAVINSFNNVSLSAFLTGPGVNMLPIEIMGYVEYHFDPTIAALATIMMVATLGVMLLIEKTLGLQSVV